MKHRCAWRHTQCVQCTKWRFSPDEAYHQCIPTLLSISGHICPIFSMHSPNPIPPSSLSVHQTAFMCQAIAFPACCFPLHFHKRLSCSAVAVSSHHPLFSPTDPVQMASRCCCNLFAFTYNSSPRLAKKKLSFNADRMLNGSPRDWVVFTVACKMSCKEHIDASNSKKLRNPFCTYKSLLIVHIFNAIAIVVFSKVGWNCC